MQIEDDGDDFQLIKDEGVRVTEPDNGLYSFMFNKAGFRAPIRQVVVDSSTSSTPEDTPIQTPVSLAIFTKPASSKATRDFLDNYGFRILPRIAITRRNVETLLAQNDIWPFSRDERKRFAEHLALQAKDEL